MAEEWQPSAEPRLVAAFASIDGRRAGLARAVEVDESAGFPQVDRAVSRMYSAPLLFFQHGS